MKFQTGNKLAKGGPRPNAGRPSDEDAKELRAALKKGVPREKVQQIFSALAARACDGDSKAAALVLAYKFGRPIERQEVSGPEGGPQEHSITIVEKNLPPANERND